MKKTGYTGVLVLFQIIYLGYKRYREEGSEKTRYLWSLTTAETYFVRDFSQGVMGNHRSWSVFKVLDYSRSKSRITFTRRTRTQQQQRRDIILRALLLYEHH